MHKDKSVYSGDKHWILMIAGKCWSPSAWSYQSKVQALELPNGSQSSSMTSFFRFEWANLVVISLKLKLIQAIWFLKVSILSSPCYGMLQIWYEQRKNCWKQHPTLERDMDSATHTTTLSFSTVKTCLVEWMLLIFQHPRTYNVENSPVILTLFKSCKSGALTKLYKK